MNAADISHYQSFPVFCPPPSAADVIHCLQVQGGLPSQPAANLTRFGLVLIYAKKLIKHIIYYSSYIRRLLAFSLTSVLQFCKSLFYLFMPFWLFIPNSFSSPVFSSTTASLLCCRFCVWVGVGQRGEAIHDTTSHSLPSSSSQCMWFAFIVMCTYRRNTACIHC